MIHIVFLFFEIQLLVSDDDVNNYNKIKTDLDKLRLLVEQSELWVYKKKEPSSGSSGSGGGNGNNKKGKRSEKEEDGQSSVNTTGSSLNSSSNQAQSAVESQQPPSIKVPRPRTSSVKMTSDDRGQEAKKRRRNEELDDSFMLHELETIGPDMDSSSIQKYKDVYSILANMIRLCVDERRDNGILRRKARRNEQRLLRNMGVHNIVLDLTKISYEKVEDKRMREIMRTAHKFLQSFCHSNPHNQALLHEKIDFSHYPSNEFEARTARFIFKDNTTLCNELSERLIQNFVHALEMNQTRSTISSASSSSSSSSKKTSSHHNHHNNHHNHQSKNQREMSNDLVDDDFDSKVPYLEFLQTICVIEGHEVKKCQDMIIAELMNSDIINFNANTSDKAHIDELCALMQKVHSLDKSDDDDNDNDSSIDTDSRVTTTTTTTTKTTNTSLPSKEEIVMARRQLDFHTNLIKVLICCTIGKNTFTEIKCHTILSLEDIERIVTYEHCLVEVKKTYISFLYHCHIDTENETKEIFTQPFIWSIFENFVKDIYYVTRDCTERYTADRELEAYVANNVIEVIIGFFSHNKFNQIPMPQSRSAIFRNLHGKLLQLYKAEWLSDTQRTNISCAINAMQDKAPMMGLPDLPIFRHTDSVNFDAITKSLQLPPKSISFGNYQQQQLPQSVKQVKSAQQPQQEQPPLQEQCKLISTHGIDNLPEAAAKLDQRSELLLKQSSIGSKKTVNYEHTPQLPSTSGASSHSSSMGFKSQARRKQSTFDGMPTNKHDTRVVNESFQDAVQMLEEGFRSKMQTEMLVLVDVLHKPSAIFPLNSIFRKFSQEKVFIAK